MNGPLTFISKHPLTRSNQLSAITRLVYWQIKSRLFSGYHQVAWIKGTRLNVKRGMHGATGNIYSGLHEFSEMGFLLHFLRPTDLFCDIGANIGSYTVLASGVVGATTISFEPDPDTVVSLRQNIEINEISNLVEVAEVALSSENTELRFSVGQDTINHIVESTAEKSRSVTARRLDDVLQGRCPSLIKIDVEGHELGVFRGASATLSDPRLLAISTEGFDDEIAALTKDHGFVPMFYDPRIRELSLEAPDFETANTLLIRQAAIVSERLRSAPKVSVLGRKY